MSASVVAFLVGTLLFVFTQRWSVFDDARLPFALIGLAIAYLGSGGLRVLDYRKHGDDGVRFGHRIALAALGVTAVAVGLYGLTTAPVVTRLGFDDEAQTRWSGVLGWLWPLVWTLGAAVLLAVDWGIRSSPAMTPRRRIVALAGQGSLVAMGLALVFPINYIAAKKNERWDLAYFKTPTPGSATRAIAESLEAPVDVRIFMPPASEVAEELRHYFADLASDKVRLQILDQASSPRLAQALKVRDNGLVAFTVGEVDLAAPETPSQAKGEGETAEKPAPITRTLRVATELNDAKRTLKKLDAEVQRILIELGHGERIAYLTTGHGELDTQGNRGVLDREARGLKERLGQLGFTVKTLGAHNGLADKIPDDADVVLVLGPHYPFQAPEVDALRTYLRNGGALLVAQEPALVREGARGGTALSWPLEDMLEEEMGVVLGDGVLAAEQGIVPITHDRLDRIHIVTNSFTSHGSSRTLAQNASNSPIFTPAAGYLEEAQDRRASVTFTVRSLAFTWVDLNLNAEYEADAGETKGARNLVAAVSGPDEKHPWRAIVTADASMFSDLAMGSRGNVMFVDDALNWLIGAEALTGTTQSEEDVKIEHTKEGQGGWFYLTVLGVPLLVFLAGAGWIRWRRRGAVVRGGAQ